MTPSTIETYVSELKQILERTLASDYAEEIVAEAQNHLTERVAELRSTGLNSADAEQQAAREFGDVAEISIELAKGYPPKPPINAVKLRFLPEIAVVVMLSFSAYCFSLYSGPRAIEAAAGNLVPAMPTLMVPGLIAGLSRLKYRRLRPLATLVRLSTYGFGLSLIATVCLIALQTTGRATLTSLYPMYYAFGIATALMYGVMKVTFSDGKVYTFLRHRLRMR